MTFHLLLSIIPCTLAVQVHPVARTVSSDATCVDGYQWMDNVQGDSPCLTAAYVEAACTGNIYSQPALQVGYSYSLPNSSTAGPCYCSWSSYNLMMACTICQGSNSSQSLWQWPQWASGCSNPSWTDVYFPSGFVLSGDASIPYWATLDPVKWTYQTFNIEDAQTAYQQNSSNVVPGSTPSVVPGSTSSVIPSPSSSSSGRKTDYSAIIGATIGTTAALALLAAGAYILYRRHAYRKGAYASLVNQPGTGHMDGSNGVTSTNIMHNRFLSDLTTYLAPGHFLSPSQQPTVCPQQMVYSSLQGQPSGAMPLV